MFVHGPVAEPDTWIWNAVAYAASQFRTTWLTVAVAPRSTWIHCGSEKALDQRVPVLPSTAAEAGNTAFSVDEAVAVLPWEISGSAALAEVATTASIEANIAPTTAATAYHRLPRGDGERGGAAAF